MLIISLLISTSAFAQITVSGKVISLDDRDELIGVSVMEIGTNNGVITDIDGKYALLFSGPNLDDESDLKFAVRLYKSL